MSFHPDVFTDWRAAKTAAGALAAAMGLQLGQDGNGKPALYRPGAPPQSFPTWLAAASHLRRLRADQIRGKGG